MLTPAQFFRNCTILTCIVYIAVDLICSLIGLLLSRRGFRSWLFSDLLAIAQLAAYIYDVQEPPSSSPVEITHLLLALWTIAAAWVWNMTAMLMVLESLLTTPRWTRTYELSFSVPHGGQLEICAQRTSKIEALPWATSHETMIDYISTKPVIHALNLGLGLVQVVAVLIHLTRRP
ncbi:hypothetical protein BGZ82_004635 [Podila clonocystis]|nr:hypothetical protein BGZ82_004635 [Podila clonocystis]